jgi:hypothetical protein
MDCVFLDDGYCSAAAVEVDPDAGCQTYSPSSDSSAGDEWEDEEELEEWEDLEGDEEEEDETWTDDEEDEF